MNLKAHPIILLMGNDKTLSYLFERFAERCGYRLAIQQENYSINEIKAANPAAIIFPSTKLLEMTQVLVGELASLDTPIIVCSSIADEARARELGADYCLIHPLTYDGFKNALARTTNISKHTNLV